MDIRFKAPMEKHIDKAGLPFQDFIDPEELNLRIHEYLDKAVDIYGFEALYEVYSYMLSRLSMALLSATMYLNALEKPEDLIPEMERLYQIELNSPELYNDENHRKVAEYSIEVEAYAVRCLTKLFTKLRELGLDQEAGYDPIQVAVAFTEAFATVAGKSLQTYLTRFKNL